MDEVWGWFWLLESLKLFNAGTSWVFTIALFAPLQDFNESSQRLTGVRAGLSTRQNSCRGLVSMGAGLPTQWDGRSSHLWLFFVIQDVFPEFRSFGWGHRPEEGLHSSYLHFGQFLVGCTRTISSIMSFLFAHVFCITCVVCQSSL